jgi:isopenicillin N synthase-like dioxygenase
MDGMESNIRTEHLTRGFFSGALTLLATAGTPGLELWTDNDWYQVEPSAGAFVVNVGGGIMLITCHSCLSHAYLLNI